MSWFNFEMWPTPWFNFSCFSSLCCLVFRPGILQPWFPTRVLAQLREDDPAWTARFLHSWEQHCCSPNAPSQAEQVHGERRCGTMVNCFYLFRAPCVIPDQVRIINQGVGESIRTEHSFIRTPFGTIIFMGFMVTRIIKQGVGESTCTGHSGSVLPLGHPQHHNIIQYPWHWWSPE